MMYVFYLIFNVFVLEIFLESIQGFESYISIPYGCLLYSKRKQSQAIVYSYLKYVNK